MKLSFFGAAQQVTGSLHLVETSTMRILVDCGMLQGSRIAEKSNFEDFPFDPATIDAVVLTHAHLDHCGRLPKLVKDGFRGVIYATPPTAQLAQLIMEDSSRVLKREADKHGHDPLYTEEDAQSVRQYFQHVEYRTPLALDDHNTVEFFDAGHILGSSIIRITGDGESVVFSGDLGNSPAPLLHDREEPGQADYVVVESTYGGRIHEDKEVRTQLLREAILQTIKSKGVLMIPAFAMERTQELLYELNMLVENKQIPQIPIFLDSPLAIKATKVFQSSTDYLDFETQSFVRGGDDVFNFPGLKFTLQTEESKNINNIPAPKVIIAGSGMANGGRILHHIKRYIEDPNSTYLIIGYQARGTLGRRLIDGEPTIKVHGEEFRVKATVKAIGGYSAHADQAALTTWLSSFDKAQLKGVFLNHGELDQQELLKAHLADHIDAEVFIPEMDQSYDLTK